MAVLDLSATLLLTLSLSLAAGELYVQEFEYEPDTLGENFETPEASNNRWILGAAGSGGGRSLQAPAGMPVSATATRSFPGFRTHTVISLTVDTRLGARWTGAPDFGLPFAVELVGDPDDPAAPVAGFHINYEAGSFGEDTRYAVGVPREGSFVWHPASALENYQPDPVSHNVAAWFRWTAVFTFDRDAGTLQTTLSAASIGQDGSAAPQPVQTWEFEPVKVTAGDLPPDLRFAVTGRARDGFGISHIDRVKITAGQPAP